MKKTIRQRLIERLWEEFQLIVDPVDIYSFRRNGYGIELISWSTLNRRPVVQSKLTMRQVTLIPNLKLVNPEPGIIEITFSLPDTDSEGIKDIAE